MIFLILFNELEQYYPSSNLWEKHFVILSNSIPAVLFLSDEHHFEHFVLKSPKPIEHVR